ncbi:hypothetical protein ACFC58_43590 [Kitasatospora purpeofusca]|uniref:hypothetical protein n=1 Tax=Kitasatospora purpeofusca TaxID=67352 RepID=UPI0035DEF800
MTRYTTPLTDTLDLQYGYDRPLHNVFAQLWENGKPLHALGLYPFITTVDELMSAIDTMLAAYPGAALDEERCGSIRRRLIADGADPCPGA